MNRTNEGSLIWRPSTNAQKWVKMLTHFLCLSIIFILPEALMSKSIGGGLESWHIYSKALVYVGAFYLNYYIIIDKCIGKRYWVLRLIGWNLLVVVAAMGVMSLTMSPPSDAGPHGPRHHDAPAVAQQLRRVSFMLKDMVMVVLTAGLSLAVKLSDYWVKLHQKNHQMEMAQRQEELDNLKHQLNPHFLFNTLNSIYALIAISPEKAQKAVHELSKLLRFVLYENSSTVTLEDELTFVDNYVRLMKLRIGDTFPVKVVLDAGDNNGCAIAPLLFISPVENAFKYGNTGKPDAFIDINITCRDSTVECRISNRFSPSTEQNSQPSGIGQSNLRRRLDIIYGDNAQIITDIDDDIYTFYLKIKLKES
ncbi:MAG: sensor histidine kinase [Muribaculum sp.]|nr:sensor histidine kinase [Muribaculum sp.]